MPYQVDDRLPEIMNAMRDDDLLFLSADHGCDPTTPSRITQERELFPSLSSGKKIKTDRFGYPYNISDWVRHPRIPRTGALNHGVIFFANFL